MESVSVSESNWANVDGPLQGTQVRGLPHLGQHKVKKHRKEQPSTILINVNDIEMVTYHQITSS